MTEYCSYLETNVSGKNVSGKNVSMKNVSVTDVNCAKFALPEKNFLKVKTKIYFCTIVQCDENVGQIKQVFFTCYFIQTSLKVCE